MAELRIIQDGKEQRVSFAAGTLLDDVLASAGRAVPHPCGGRGVCGKCAVSLTGEASPPDDAEKRLGSRLSCQAVLLGDCSVTLPDSRSMDIETEGDSHIDLLRPLGTGLGAALDIGTTTLALTAYDLNTGEAVGEAAMLNPQTVIAADVMGRIGAAIDGRLSLMRQQVTGALDSLLAAACGDRVREVSTLVAAGNTTMLYLFTGRDPVSLSRSPFKADCLFNCWTEHDGARIYLPACMNAFVGADITCAALASEMCESPDTALLCDIGTNGEIALWRDGELYVTSTAAGPAFEGAGISCGCGSVTGAIDKVWTENGRLAVHTIGGSPAVGLCGSGLIDAVAALLESGEIDETGAMEAGSISIAPNVVLLPGDVRSVQLAKAALAAGIATVLERAGVSCADVSRLYIAGGFGKHLRLSSAAAIGLIPRELTSRAKVIGNGSLSGAARILRDSGELEKSLRIAGLSRHVDLGGNPSFNQHYMDNMMF